MARVPYIGGNWKMNLSRREAIALAGACAEKVAGVNGVEVAVFPPFPFLADVADVLNKRGSKIKLGAQDAYHQPSGAFTGEVSLSMLKDLGVRVVLVGHSERRHVIGESDALINDKTLAVLEAGLEAILCVGEKLEQREKGKTDAINMGQTLLGLAGVTAEQMTRVTIAYEPVWAIGTGKTASAADAESAHKKIRDAISFGLFDGRSDIGEAVRIQYGGSVKPSNAKELFSQPNVDGGLVGGACLKVEDFAPIVQAAG